MPRKTHIFLTAEWRYLAMLNFEVDPGVLAPHVPAGTELDTFEGRTMVSVVGFRFEDTRVRGVAVPFHRDFDEINLRFYVRRDVSGEARRGVVFIKEIVPRVAIAWTARLVYAENYVALPTRHSIGVRNGGCPGQVSYEWKWAGRWNSVSVRSLGEARPLVAGSEEQFIAEHYWGYSSRRDGRTVEYRVEHPSWRAWPVDEARLDCDVSRLYGAEFADFLGNAPCSALLADGSAVSVRRGELL
ncbi:MAG: DUF2071 domain-containing protein [Pirellulales bacterium]